MLSLHLGQADDRLWRPSSAYDLTLVDADKFANDMALESPPTIFDFGSTNGPRVPQPMGLVSHNQSTFGLNVTSLNTKPPLAQYDPRSALPPPNHDAPPQQDLPSPEPMPKDDYATSPYPEPMQQDSEHQPDKPSASLAAPHLDSMFHRTHATLPEASTNTNDDADSTSHRLTRPSDWSQRSRSAKMKWKQNHRRPPNKH